MHQFHKGIEKRLTSLELRLGAIPTIETAAEISRRLELCRAALEGHEPANLTATERPMFSKMVRDVPLLFELLDEGALDAYLDGDDHPDRDEDPHEPVWSP